MVHIREILVEITGTFFLCFVGGISIFMDAPLVSVSIAHGFIIALMICMGGPITGAQYNPAVSVALIVTKDLPVVKGAIYILSQFAGSFLAGAVLAISLPGTANDYNTSPGLADKVNQYRGFILEFIGTFTLLVAIYTGIRTKKSEQTIAVYVALTLMAMINAIGPLTGCSLNPARTLGPYMFAHGFQPVNTTDQPFFVYYLAPILGGIAGGTFSKYVIHSDESLKQINGETAGDEYKSEGDSKNFA
jgi:glycerol uptake facilitator-like aquaporin